MDTAASAATKTITRLIWHRRDLRLQDNELYEVSSMDASAGEDDWYASASASVETTRVVALYVINPADYEPRRCCCSSSSSSSNSDDDPSPLETVAVGPHAARAICAALRDLRRSLRLLGGDLIVRRGNPIDIVPELAREINADEVYWGEEPGYYERRQSERMKQTLMLLDNSNSNTSSKKRPLIKTVMGYTLFHPDDLPRGQDTWNKLARPKEKKKKQKNVKTPPVETSASSSHEVDNTGLHKLVDISQGRFAGLPRIMGDFRRAARTAAPVRPCQNQPTDSISFGNNWHNLDPGPLPTLEELTAAYQDKSLFGLPPVMINSMIAAAKASEQVDNNLTCPTGGETTALENLRDFVEHHAASADRSLVDVSGHQSARTSTHLATGALSPRQIYWLAAVNNNQPGCEWLMSHMEMRDYFIYSSLVADKKLYRLQGDPVRGAKKGGEPMEWKPVAENMESFVRWATGETKLPLVDAGMKELVQTGYCSNRVRQNLASVLTKDLKIDWRIGAEWFQFCLEDHCVAANWGNWQYFSGVGGDPKNRHFRTVSQAMRYDSTGAYVQKWLPALRDVAELEACFRPWDFISEWGTPLIDPSSQYTWQDHQNLKSGCSLSTQLAT
jgi:deoxyribodipyrimidine photo-lyase